MSTLTDLFTDIADAIRSKDGTSASIAAEDFAERIEAIETAPTTFSTVSFPTTEEDD